MNNSFRLACLGLVLCGMLRGQLGLRFKSQSLPGRTGNYENGLLTSISRTSGVEGTEHFVLQVSAPVTPGTRERLSSPPHTGPFGYLPENALMVSIHEPSVSLQDLPVTWAGKLGPTEKLSPVLNRYIDPDGKVYAIAQFHSDVDGGSMRQIASNASVEWFERQGLAAHAQLLVQASHEGLAKLVENDAVAYIFPASADVIAGLPIAACSSGQTAAGQGVPNAPTFGDGWDGAGLNAASVSYTFGPMTPEMPAKASSNRKSCVR